MSLTRSWYREFGLKLVSLEDNLYHMPKKPSMDGENKYDGMGDPFKMFLKESLERQRNNMCITLRKSLDDQQQTMHLRRAEVSPPSRYISTLIFLYLKVK
jgi:hypothetical protein